MKFTILQCKRFIAPYTSKIIERTVKDYELDFFVGGNRDIYIDGVKYHVSEGDICFRKPGQRVYGLGDHNAFLLTLDFSGMTPVKNYSRNTAVKIQEIYDHELLNSLPPVFHTANAEKFKFLFLALSLQSDYRCEAAGALVMEILYRLNADLKHSFFEKIAPLNSAVDKAAQYIHFHYSEKITLEMLSREACLDKGYFVRSFKKKYKKTPIDYLIGVRLDNASELVLSTELPISNIAECCGYNNESLFIAQYKERFGITPAKHRKQIRENEI